MKLSLVWALGVLLCAPALAQRVESLHSGGNTDVVVDMPPEVWTQGQNRQQSTPCAQCCLYENRSYSEGAVVKAEGILLQCTRDEKVLGTNPLVWRQLK
ncbi:DUF1496 domain-containing protein [Paramixta manurensis]|uniref:DUF1496 domain-containing protein n=1 Tax=Paramixta manurensis TaxID=2740817 RepID=A0A6M8U9E4_9GAMM|nr:DUF1496 domain-containing protein [Erwiniaceae bacterium PD-1]